MRSAWERNVRNLNFDGHGKSHCGIFWLKHESASEYEVISIDIVAGRIKTEAAGENRMRGAECV